MAEYKDREHFIAVRKADARPITGPAMDKQHPKAPPMSHSFGPPQRQVVLRLDQEEPWYLGDPCLQPGLVLGDGRVQHVEPPLEQAG